MDKKILDKILKMYKHQKFTCKIVVGRRNIGMSTYAMKVLCEAIENRGGNNNELH